MSCPTVADQRADDREAGLLGDRLDRVRDVGQVRARARLFDPGPERCLAGLEEPLGLAVHLAHLVGVGRVADEALVGDATSTESTSPSDSCFSSGIPWTTTSFSDAQIEAG